MQLQCKQPDARASHAGLGQLPYSEELPGHLLEVIQEKAMHTRYSVLFTRGEIPVHAEPIHISDLMGLRQTLTGRLARQEPELICQINKGPEPRAEVFVRDGPTVYETCPVCKEPLVKAEYGHMAEVGGPDYLDRCRAYWHCPDCGDSIVIVDCVRVPYNPEAII